MTFPTLLKAFGLIHIVMGLAFGIPTWMVSDMMDWEHSVGIATMSEHWGSTLIIVGLFFFSDAQFARGSFARVHQASVNRTDNTASNATVSRSDRSNSNGCYVVSACNHFSRLPVFHIRTWHRCLSVQKNSVLAVL